MYAVVKSGGKQYRVEEGQVLRVEKIAGDVGQNIDFDEVLMVSDGENTTIGQPRVENVTVSGRIVEQGKAPKVIVFKFKRRKRFRKKNGHRQPFTAIQIDKIQA